MREREAIKQIAQIGAFVGFLYAASTLALSRENRLEAGRRDGWQCQADSEGSFGVCLGARYFQRSQPLDFKSGFYVQLAHYNNGLQYHNHPMHDHIDSARCLCTMCHAAEEVARGNYRGAGLVLRSGVYNIHGEKQLGGNLYFSVDDLEEFMRG